MNAKYSAAWAVACCVVLTGLAGCSRGSSNNDSGADGPASSEAPVAHAVGDATRGKAVFRFELFGTERFWTDAVRLQQGIVAAGVTPIDALKLGLSVDVEALDAATAAAVVAELKTDLSPANAPLLNSPATTLKLINANAVIGIVAVDSNGDGTIDVANGDKTGASCALCHTITDASVFNLPGGGSMGVPSTTSTSASSWRRRSTPARCIRSPSSR